MDAFQISDALKWLNGPMLKYGQVVKCVLDAQIHKLNAHMRKRSQV